MVVELSWVDVVRMMGPKMMSGVAYIPYIGIQDHPNLYRGIAYLSVCSPG